MILSTQKKAATALFLTIFIAACGSSETTVNTDPDPDSDPDTGTSSTTDITTGNWVINNDDERSINLFQEGSNTGILVNITSVETETIDDVDYVSVASRGIPNYSTVVDQDLLDSLAARPNSVTDFVNGSPDISVGDVVEFGQDIGYFSNGDCNETGGYGYWAPGPVCPEEGDISALFTTTPAEATEECSTGIGAIGLFSNGASIYDWNDTQSYEGEGVWQHIASKAEVHDLDICAGHSAAEYHHHNYSSCLADELGDVGDGHSPAYGVSADGYPVHGPWHSDGTLVVSSWLTRDYDDVNSETGCGVSGERSCLLVDQYDITQGTTATTNIAPLTTDTIISMSQNALSAESGFYFQDYYHAPELAALGGEYLDEHNGHDHDDLGYHYHLTVAENTEGGMTPTFPYSIGPKFKGALDDNAMRSCTAEGGVGGGDGSPDFGPTAEQVSLLSGVTVTADDIENGLGDDGPPDCDDIINAATSFGITAEQLVEAGLPIPPGLDCDFL